MSGSYRLSTDSLTKRRVSIRLELSSTAGNIMTMNVGNSNPPGLSVAHVGHNGAYGSIAIGIQHTLYTEVPNGHYYKLASSCGSTCNLLSWHELDE